MEEIIDLELVPSKNYKIIAITLIIIGWIAVLTLAGTVPTSFQDGLFSSMMLLAAIPATIGLSGVLVAETKIAQRIAVAFAFLSPVIIYFANIILFNTLGVSLGGEYHGAITFVFQIILSASFIYFVFYKDTYSRKRY